MSLRNLHNIYREITGNVSGRYKEVLFFFFVFCAVLIAHALSADNENPIEFTLTELNIDGNDGIVVLDFINNFNQTVTLIPYYSEINISDTVFPVFFSHLTAVPGQKLRAFGYCRGCKFTAGMDFMWKTRVNLTEDNLIATYIYGPLTLTDENFTDYQLIYIPIEFSCVYDEKKEDGRRFFIPSTNISIGNIRDFDLIVLAINSITAGVSVQYPFRNTLFHDYSISWACHDDFVDSIAVVAGIKDNQFYYGEAGFTYIDNIYAIDIPGKLYNTEVVKTEDFIIKKYYSSLDFYQERIEDYRIIGTAKWRNNDTINFRLIVNGIVRYTEKISDKSGYKFSYGPIADRLTGNGTIIYEFTSPKFRDGLQYIISYHSKKAFELTIPDRLYIPIGKIYHTAINITFLDAVGDLSVCAETPATLSAIFINSSQGCIDLYIDAPGKHSVGIELYTETDNPELVTIKLIASDKNLTTQRKLYVQGMLNFDFTADIKCNEIMPGKIQCNNMISNLANFNNTFYYIITGNRIITPVIGKKFVGNGRNILSEHIIKYNYCSISDRDLDNLGLLDNIYYSAFICENSDGLCESGFIANLLENSKDKYSAYTDSFEAIISNIRNSVTIDRTQTSEILKNIEEERNYPIVNSVEECIVSNIENIEIRYIICAEIVPEDSETRCIDINNPVSVDVSPVFILNTEEINEPIIIQKGSTATLTIELSLKSSYLYPIKFLENIESDCKFFESYTDNFSIKENIKRSIMLYAERNKINKSRCKITYSLYPEGFKEIKQTRIFNIEVIESDTIEKKQEIPYEKDEIIIEYIGDNTVIISELSESDYSAELRIINNNQVDVYISLIINERVIWTKKTLKANEEQVYRHKLEESDITKGKLHVILRDIKTGEIIAEKEVKLNLKKESYRIYTPEYIRDGAVIKIKNTGDIDLSAIVKFSGPFSKCIGLSKSEIDIKPGKSDNLKIIYKCTKDVMDSLEDTSLQLKITTENGEKTEYIGEYIKELTSENKPTEYPNINVSSTETPTEIIESVTEKIIPEPTKELYIPEETPGKKGHNILYLILVSFSVALILTFIYFRKTKGQSLYKNMNSQYPWVNKTTRGYNYQNHQYLRR